MNLTFPVGEQLLIGFLLAMSRSTAWVMVCPPFGTRLVPTQVKLGLSVSFALALAPKMAAQNIPLDTASIVTAVFLQVVAGLALGFIGMLLFSSFTAAGGLIDLAGGFSMAQVLDPMSGIQNTIFARFYQLLATVLLFAIDGHVLLVRGFLTSFQALPLTSLDVGQMGKVFTDSFALFFLAALEIAAPLLAALFLTDIALGMLAKAAPEMNILLLGLPVKVILTLALITLALPILPHFVADFVDHAVRAGQALTG
jgi:flagellar biosynthesis protein FliR